MDLILLPGNSKNNRKWIEEVASNFANLFNKRIIQYYRHWGVEGQNINLEFELKQLSQTSNDVEAPYSIFAKSAGTILAMQGMIGRVISPKYCIFTGTPLLFAEKLEISLKSMLQEIQVPILFFQKNGDPAGNSNELKNLLESLDLSRYKLIEIAGDDHEYTDLSLLRKYITEFITFD